MQQLPKIYHSTLLLWKTNLTNRGEGLWTKIERPQDRSLPVNLRGLCVTPFFGSIRGRWPGMNITGEWLQCASRRTPLHFFLYVGNCRYKRTVIMSIALFELRRCKSGIIITHANAQRIIQSCGRHADLLNQMMHSNRCNIRTGCKSPRSQKNLGTKSWSQTVHVMDMYLKKGKN